MPEGRFELSVRVGDFGFMGRVILTVEPGGGRWYERYSPKPLVEFDPNASPDWHTAVEFGLLYAVRYLPESVIESVGGDKGFRVKVKEIWGMLGVTSEMIIGFVAANALWDAFRYAPPNPPIFHEKKGVFVFPAYRQYRGVTEEKDIPMLISSLKKSLEELLPELRAFGEEGCSDLFEIGLNRLESLPPIYSDDLRDVLGYLQAIELRLPRGRLRELYYRVFDHIVAFQFSDREEK